MQNGGYGVIALLQTFIVEGMVRCILPESFAFRRLPLHYITRCGDKHAAVQQKVKVSLLYV